MKRVGLLMSVLTLLIITSCKTEEKKSEYQEFQIDSKNLSDSRTVGVYLPSGYSKKNEYPVIYAEDGLVLKDGNYVHILDSLIDNGYIKPVIVAFSCEIKKKVEGTSYSVRNVEYVESISKADETLLPIFDNHMKYFLDEFIPTIESKYSVSKNSSDRIYYGTSNSADFGLTVSMRYPELMDEYWCFSPMASDMTGYGLMEKTISYKICWGVREEMATSFMYFSSLIQSIRKRGGSVKDWTFNGAHDRNCWREEFIKSLILRFGIE